MSTQPFRILITPLNWGLGHATRCLPIASAFAKTTSTKKNVEIHWASDGQALALLKAELPEKTLIHELPSYGVSYPTRSASVNMVLGGPKMGAAVLQEYKAIAELHRRYSYDFILSDNRFGCRVPGVRSAIMTHQVHLPIRNWFSRKLGNVLNHRFLSKFDQIIIPDEKLQPRLAGNMSAPHPKCPTTYIGPVSRFSIPPQQKSPTTSIALAIVLSGPEPQRTILEDLLLKQLTSTALSGIIILVRGRPKHAPAIPEGVLRQVESAGQQLEVHNFMKGAELERVLAKADIILTRPGYTTVMDLSVLRRKAIFTPTPGQPEQEWLGRSLHAAGLGICIEQSQLRLTEAIEKWKTINHQSERGASRKSSLLKEWVDQILTHTEP